ncbi:MAG: energy-coupling factor transporter transmembrane component T [[Ruminococcus] torques]
MARFALASSTMSHMTSALKKMHFPVVLIIPITVMARFFHTAREDYNQVKDAMYLHGLTNRRLFFHPVKLFEYRMVPLFMVLTKTADDVAVSAMTRGLKIHGKRTYIGESRFCMRDYICFLLMLVLIGFYIGDQL